MKNYYNNIIEKTKISVKTILEIGSRDGNDANELMKHFQLKDENVWVVEPNPNQINIIKDTYPNFNLVPNAIFREETEHDFYQVDNNIPNDVGTSSLINRNDNWYESKTNIIKVKTITGKQLLNKINREVDVCKIDVEGLTIEVLISFGETLNQIKSFHLECEHREVWKNQKLYDDVAKFLIDNNYTQIYFEYCSGGTLQSDSIWVLNNYLK
jgi:FkbM family methyltransferase